MEFIEHGILHACSFVLEAHDKFYRESLWCNHDSLLKEIKLFAWWLMTRTTKHVAWYMISKNVALASNIFSRHERLLLFNCNNSHNLNTLIYLLPINLNPHPSHTTFPRQPSLRIPIVERKRRHSDEKQQSSSTQAQPKCDMNILQGKANEEGQQLYRMFLAGIHYLAEGIVYSRLISLDQGWRWIRSSFGLRNPGDC